MLLYALACRHGWGMRPNQKEGVMWLRKAMDCASIEMTNDVDDSSAADYEGRKTRRAQFALSVYELGVSHMKGWGIEQDKALALRCFEIASSWGDPDAMAEAGFCYAEGVGCKKDLKKAAKYYRDAEAKGMSMVGNSWYESPKLGQFPRLLISCTGSISPSMQMTQTKEVAGARRRRAAKRNLGTNHGHGLCLGGRKPSRKRHDSSMCSISTTSSDSHPKVPSFRPF